MTVDIESLSALRVLLIEDDEADVFLVQEILRGGAEKSAVPNFELVVGSTLAEGLDLLQREPIDVVLLDLMLPDSRGMESLRKVAAAAGTTPIVVLSSINDEEMLMEAARNGAQDYLVKGHVEAMWLARIMRYAVARRNSILALRRQVALFTAAFDLSTDAMLVLDADGVVRASNPAMNALAGVTLTGLSAADWRARLVLLGDNGSPIPDADLPPAACRNGCDIDRPVQVRAAGVPNVFAARLRAISAPKGTPDASVVVQLSLR